MRRDRHFAAGLAVSCQLSAVSQIVHAPLAVAEEAVPWL
jgi:hypothetical protein